MIRLTILMVGKTKESWLEAALEDYHKRLQGQIQILWVSVKTDQALLEKLPNQDRVVALDPRGEEMDSPQFSRFLFREIEAGGSRLTLVIGGAEGLPEAIRSRVPLISLSRLTFTHQIVRLVVAEQIYRAWSIRHGLPYHK